MWRAALILVACGAPPRPIIAPITVPPDATPAVVVIILDAPPPPDAAIDPAADARPAAMHAEVCTCKHVHVGESYPKPNDRIGQSGPGYRVLSVSPKTCSARVLEHGSHREYTRSCELFYLPQPCPECRNQ